MIAESVFWEFDTSHLEKTTFGSLQLQQDVADNAQGSAKGAQPLRFSTYAHRQPIRIGCASAKVLAHLPDHMGLQHRFRNEPRMYCERSDTEREEEVIILIADLLKAVFAILPPGRELDFNSPSRDQPVSRSIR